MSVSDIKIWTSGLGIQQPLIMADWAEIDPVQARFAMLFERKGLNVVSPDFIMPKFEFEPITEADLIGMSHRAYWYKRANTSKLRSIIRKAKKTWH
jgi:hypothetical protein